LFREPEVGKQQFAMAHLGIDGSLYLAARAAGMDDRLTRKWPEFLAGISLCYRMWRKGDRLK